LFAYRKAQSWPPVVIKQDGWSDLYESLSDGLPVIENVDDAVQRANELIV